MTLLDVLLHFVDILTIFDSFPDFLKVSVIHFFTAFELDFGLNLSGHGNESNLYFLQNIWPILYHDYRSKECKICVIVMKSKDVEMKLGMLPLHP